MLHNAATTAQSANIIARTEKKTKDVLREQQFGFRKEKEQGMPLRC
jgi:hypothetical protein